MVTRFRKAGLYIVRWSGGLILVYILSKASAVFQVVIEVQVAETSWGDGFVSKAWKSA